MSVRQAGVSIALFLAVLTAGATAQATDEPGGVVLPRIGKARRLGYYELIEPLGKGGMGEIWRAKHRMLARPAAIKLISPEAAGVSSGELTATMIRRFEQEAQTTATLQSQHTIQLYDFGVTDDGALYYALHRMEERGLIESEWRLTGNNRKARYYRMRPAGRAHLRTEGASLERYARALADILAMRTG